MRLVRERDVPWASELPSLADVTHPVQAYLNALARSSRRPQRKTEACRALCWKAARYLDMYDSEGHAIGATAKVYCTETMFEAVFQCMQVMEVNVLGRVYPLEKLLREAVVLPL